MNRTTNPATARGERASEVYESLREMIVWGRIAPETRIIEADIAERLGVSRGTVRPALLRLQQEGFVSPSKPGRQTRLVVTPVTQEDASELLFLVGEIEGLAAWWAARRPAEERQALGGRLQKLNEELLERLQLETLDANRFLEIDRTFHRHFVEMGGGPRTLGLHESLKPQMERYGRLYTGLITEHVFSALREHEEIHQAIVEGEAEMAQKAVQANWRNGANRMRDVIDRFQQRTTLPN